MRPEGTERDYDDRDEDTRKSHVAWREGRANDEASVASMTRFRRSAIEIDGRQEINGSVASLCFGLEVADVE